MSRFVISFEGSAHIKVPGNGGVDERKLINNIKKIITDSLENHYMQAPSVTEIVSSIEVTNVMSIIGAFADDIDLK